MFRAFRTRFTGSVMEFLSSGRVKNDLLAENTTLNMTGVRNVSTRIKMIRVVVVNCPRTEQWVERKMRNNMLGVR